MTSEPVGIQRTRAKVEVLDGVRHDLNWRSKQINGLPAKVVTRGTAWGNSYKIGEWYDIDGTQIRIVQENCLLYYERYVRSMLESFPDWLEPLRGHNLACFCKSGAVCHRNTLLKLLKEVYPDDDQ